MPALAQIALVALSVGGMLAETQALPPPLADRAVLWEAESATGQQQWDRVAHEWASGGAYVQPASLAKAPALAFSFEVTRPTTLRLRPVWWAHGEQKPAKRFPDPLPSTIGPSALGALGRFVFFTAPATGRVGIIDARTEAVVGSVQTNGYPRDLVGDAQAGRVYVADAAGDRVLIVDAAKRAVVDEIKVAGAPWSLALQDNRLFVACLKGNCVAVVDTASGRVLRRVSVGAPAVGVSLGGQQPQVLVARQPLVLRPDTLEEETPDRFEYQLPGHRQAGYPFPTPAEMVNALPTKYFEAPEPHTLLCVNTEKKFDVSAVTGGPLSQESLPQPLAPEAGPEALDEMNEKLFFTSPATGKVGAFDMVEEALVGTAEIGGYVADVAADARRGKVYVAEALGNRVVTLDAQTLKVTGQVAVPERPVSVALFQDNLYVACYQAKSLAVVDTTRGRVVQTLPLGDTPLEVHCVRLNPRYSHTVYVSGPFSVPFWLTPDRDAPYCVAVVLPRCVSFDAATLAQVPTPADAPPPDAHTRVSVSIPAPASAAPGGGDAVPEQVKSFRAYDGYGLACVDGKRWLDLGSACDPQVMDDQARLRVGDQPGTITLAMDSGPECDWKRDIWVTPDNEMLLVNETEEFWEWNGPIFAVGPGKHTLKVRAHSPFARLDALEVTASLADRLGVEFVPDPAAKADVPLANYHGVFYDREPVRISVVLRNQQSAAQQVAASYEIVDFMGEPVARGRQELRLGPRGQEQMVVTPDLEGYGAFNLRVTLGSAEGALARQCWFLRVPKLGNPRLLFRKDDMAAIRERIAEHPRLFARYEEWLLRNCDREGFLPKTLLVPYRSSNEYYDATAKWRAVACQFAAMFLGEPAASKLAARAGSLREQGWADQATFIHNWLRGALAFLYDMAAADSESAREQIGEIYSGAWQDLERREENVLSLQEPITPSMRASLYQQMTWLVNIDRYFSVHAGRRGGNFYQNTHSFCCCPLFGTMGAYLLYRNLLGMPNLFDRSYIAGWFTHYRYVYPRFGRRGVIAPPRTNCSQRTGSVLDNIDTITTAMAGLSAHPLEKYLNGWDEWIARMDGEDALSDEQVDKLLDGIDVCIPMFLAFGWYRPSAPQVAWEDLPPTALFDGEGEVVMNSSWDRDATSVFFACGVRDCVPRYRPGHFHIIRSGETLMTAPCLQDERLAAGDHGQPVPTWGNTVTAGDDWPQFWMRGVGHPRGVEEHLVANRNSSAGQVYAWRNLALTSGRVPGTLRWYAVDSYGLGFHEHVPNPFMQEAAIVAYETRPEFDYVAGDMTNAWRCEDVDEAYRQILFLKPDVVVLYDRLVLREPLERTRWLSATGPELAVEGSTFTVKANQAALRGEVLLPTGARLTPRNTDDFGETIGLPVLVIEPPSRGKTAEYLVVMRTGSASALPALECDALPSTPEHAGVSLTMDGRSLTVWFERTGAPGGKLVVGSGPGAVQQELVRTVDDSYRHWSGDPRYARWVNGPEFRFMRIPGSDQR